MYSFQQKAQLLHQLAASARAGLPLHVALGPDVLPPAFRRQSPRLLHMLEKGRPLSAVLAAGKLLAPWEARLLAVGESAGTLEQTLADLERWSLERHLRFTAVRSRLLYPLVVFAVLSLVGPLPALVRGEMTTGGYAGLLLVKVILVSLAYRLLVLVPFGSAGGGAFNPLLLRCSQWVDREHWLRQLFEIAYLGLLTTCLAAGLDAVSSLRLLKDAIAAPALQRRHTTAINQIGKHGISLTQALSGCGLVSNPQILGFLNAGERAGHLHGDLRHYLARRQNDMDALVRHKFTQYGRVLYVVFLLAGLVH